MEKAKVGDTVQVHYTGTLEDGTPFDSSSGRGPVEFTIGAGTILPAFEEATVGMEQGEKKTVTIPAAEAYGGRHDELIQEVDRGLLPAHLEPEIGMRLEATAGPDSQPLTFTVTDISEATVTLDANHPLAGEDLTFDIELVAIV